MMCISAESVLRWSVENGVWYYRLQTIVQTIVYREYRQYTYQLNQP